MKFVSAVALGVGASGCAIAPDIKNVARLDPVSVVRHIECETQVALIETIATRLVDILPAGQDLSLLKAWLLEPNAASRLSRLSSLSVDELYRIAVAYPEAADYLMAWDGVVIGFGYTFDVTEQNIDSGGLNFSFLTGIGAVKVDASASADKTRQNKKSFTVITSVPLLMQSGACMSPAAVKERQRARLAYGPLAGKPDADTVANIARTQIGNYVYPITGSIGMKDSLTTFSGIWRGTSGGQVRTAALPARKANLDAYGLLPGTFAKDDNAGGYNQVLTFTTKLSGKLAPSIELSSSNLNKASISSDNSRTDKHELILSFSAPSPAEIEVSKRRFYAVRNTNALRIREALYRNAVASTRAATPSIASAIEAERRLLAFERLAAR